jgi:hypothetical protein
MQLHCRRAAVLFLVLLLHTPLGFGQGVVSRQQSVPSWVAWRVFQDSLAFYNKKDAQSTRKMLNDKLGLSPAQATKLISSGIEFIADLDTIDVDARTEVRKRYAGKTLLANKDNKPRVPKTIHQRAVEDGFDAEVQKRRQTAHAKHRDALVQAFGMLKYTQINGFIVKTVLPQIKQLQQVTPKIVADARSAVLPPNAKRPSITLPQLPKRGK